jgi:predicted adenylyl cyclase CyaB
VIELEVKAVVPDPAALAERLRAAGAAAGFAGLMEDRRFDRDGELAARGESLRIRRYGPASSPQITWKGPTSMDRGYKERRELEVAVGGDDPVDELLHALGFRVVESIDRYVEYWELAGATIRLEWYPRMDVLVEIEGHPAAIERAAAATGIPRAEFRADALPAFVARFEAREQRRAATALADLGGDPPSWNHR